MTIIVLALGGCATTREPKTGTATGQTALKDICAQNGVEWQWDHVSQVATLRYKDAKAEVLVGSDIVLIGGERVSLSAPVQTIRSSVMVPADFHAKVIQRLRSEGTVMDITELPQVRKIVIDAGHGGKDPGAIGHRGVQEKEIVLDIALRLEKILKDKGFLVTMTRDKDVFITLQERTEIASRANADLFVSVHANSNPSRSVTGLEVYVANDMSFKERDEDQRKINRRLLLNGLAAKKDSESVEKIVDDMLYAHKQVEAGRLAEHFGERVVKATRTKDRGVKGSRFFVVRNTLIPAVLVEVGFLSNPKEASQLQSGLYRQQLADALAESIIDYARNR